MGTSDWVTNTNSPLTTLTSSSLTVKRTSDFRLWGRPGPDAYGQVTWMSLFKMVRWLKSG